MKVTAIMHSKHVLHLLLSFSTFFFLLCDSDGFSNFKVFIQLSHLVCHLRELIFPIFQAADSEIADVLPAFKCNKLSSLSTEYNDHWNSLNIVLFFNFLMLAAIPFECVPRHLSVGLFKLLLSLVTWNIDDIDHLLVDVDFMEEVFERLSKLFARWTPSSTEIK